MEAWWKIDASWVKGWKFGNGESLVEVWWRIDASLVED